MSDNKGRTTSVIDGKLCIEQGGARVWFTRRVLEEYIEKLEKELICWRERLDTLARGTGTVPQAQNDAEPTGEQ